MQIATDSLSRDTVQNLQRCIDQIWAASPHPWEVWPKGRPFGTPDDYCKAVTGHSWKALTTIIDEMGHEQFDLLNRMQSDLARAQVEHRGQGTRTDLLRDDITKLRGEDNKSGGGTSAAYLLRRLARDHADVLARYETGEFKSVRAAAKAAGLVKDQTPFQIVQRCWPKLTPQERETIINSLDERKAENG